MPDRRRQAVRGLETRFDHSPDAIDEPEPERVPLDIGRADWHDRGPDQVPGGPEPRSDQRELLVDRRPDQVAPTGERPQRLLEHAEPLQSSRRRTPLERLHADRLTVAPDDAARSLIEQHGADPHPRSWISEINPGFTADVVEARAGRTENCADCARAVQETLEGHPRAACSIDERGIPLRDDPEAGGEASDYTEQWAGRRAQPTTYVELGDELRRDVGSAIVFVSGDTGHATNAFYDRSSDTVLWLDGQLGRCEPWPPTELVERFPRVDAIQFPDAQQETPP